jgi:hypothetical protein
LAGNGLNSLARPKGYTKTKLVHPLGRAYLFVSCILI